MASINPLADKRQYLVDIYPEIAAFKGLSWENVANEVSLDSTQFDQIIRFSILLVDMNGRVKARDMESRRREAMRLIMHNFMVSDEVVEIMEKMDYPVPLFMFDYVRYVGDIKVQRWISYLMAYWNMMAMLMSPTKQNDSKKLSESFDAIEEMEQRIMKVEAEIYPDSAMAQKMRQAVTLGQLTGFAEMFAQYRQL